MINKEDHDTKSGIRYDIVLDPKTGKIEIKNPTLSEIIVIGVVAGIVGLIGFLGNILGNKR